MSNFYFFSVMIAGAITAGTGGPLAFGEDSSELQYAKSEVLESVGGLAATKSLVVRSDGRFDATCLDGTSGVVSDQQIFSNQICGGGIDPRLVKEAGGLDGVCTSRSRSELDASCHQALRRWGTESCLNKGYSGVIVEVEDTYSFSFGSAGPCSSTSGDYVVTSCEAYFRCQ